MVKVTKEAAQKSRAGLLQATGQAMREHGVAVATVAHIAAKAGLTHGAIYRHFPSKDAIAAAAISADFDTILGLLHGIAAKGGDLSDYYRAYLAEDHRDHFLWGCPVAPLAAEISRSDMAIQTAFTEGLERNVAGIAALSGITDAAAARTYAIAALATLSGAMAMARAIRSTDPDGSRQILHAALHALLADPRVRKSGG